MVPPGTRQSPGLLPTITTGGSAMPNALPARYKAAVDLNQFRSPADLLYEIQVGSDLHRAIWTQMGFLDQYAPHLDAFGDYLWDVFRKKPIHPDAATHIPGSDGRRMAKKMDGLAHSAGENLRLAAADMQAIWSLIVTGWGEVGAGTKKQRNDIDMSQ
jgi:hypothetical protein